MKDLLYKTYEDLFSDLSDREAFIMKNKFGIEDGKERTLASIGRDLNLTRERIRQIYNSIIEKLKNKIQQTQYFDDIYGDFREKLGKLHIKREKFIVKKISTTYSLETKEEKIVKLLIRVLPDYFYHKETEIYYSFISYENFLKKALEILNKINSDLVKSKKIWEENELIELVGSEINSVFKISPDIEDIYEFIKILKNLGKNPLNEFGYIFHKRITPSSLGDKIYLTLKLEKRPMHFSEIYERLNEISKIEDELLHHKWKKYYSPQSVLSALIADKRFVWYGRGMYALKEDGYEEGTIVDLMKKIIRKNKKITEKELFDYVRKHKKVSEHTFKIYISKYFNKKGDFIYLK